MSQVGDGDDGKILSSLLPKRSSIKGQITKFKNYLENLSKSDFLTAVETAELTLKLNKFEDLSKRFDELQSQIEVFNYINLTSELDERDKIDNDFVSTIVMAKGLLDKHNSRRKSSHVHNLNDSLNLNQSVIQCSLDHNEMGFKLPLIQIAKFNGSYFHWLEFRDTFTSLIHNNDRISSVSKFHYLISYLEGEAARIISNLEVSSANYNDAWRLLLDRYNNKRLLISSHLNSIFSMQTLTRESDKSLRYLIDNVTKNLRALHGLGQEVDKWDLLIIHIISSKLDTRTLTKWEEHRNMLDDNITFDQFKKFINDRADVLESLNRNKLDLSRPNTSSHTHSSIKHDRSQIKSFSCTQDNSSFYSCPSCKDKHRIYDCPKFKAMSITERITEISKLKLCTNCLRAGHNTQNCRLGPCRECKKRHNTLLHIPTNNTENVPKTHANYSNQNTNQVLLSTAMIEVRNPVKNIHKRVRALLDSGSESSFLSESLKQTLQLDSCPTQSINLIGIGNNSVHKINESCIAQINSINKPFTITSNFFVLKQVTGQLPNISIDIKTLNIPKDIVLADPNFYLPSEIDMLIGADMFWDILGCNQHSLGVGLPKLHSSKFGWLISGPISHIHTNHCTNKQTNIIKSHHGVLKHASQVDNIHHDLTKFWELEEVPLRSTLNTSEKACEKHFLSHTSRSSSGRFCVQLPLIDSPDCLGDTYSLAKKRFHSLERRFRKQPEVKKQYVNFIREYESLGHLSECPTNDPSSSHYLIHHAVFKETSESTKLRVVFDGSQRTSSGLSLNDLQMVGPNIQDSLFSILIRARQYKYLLTGDIEKMYRQIEIHEEDRKLQLILWREDEHLPLRTLQLNTVTYGFASASYLSTRCLWQTGEECDDSFIRNIIQHDFYVDDLITGSNSKNEIQYIQESVSKALSSGCFKLRKYRSNLPSVFESSTIDLKEELSLSESSSTLGLGWNSHTDTLHFSIELTESANEVISKRLILSKSFKIFDPLGLLSPCIIIPKLLLQQLWLEKVDWDTPVSQEAQKSWSKFAKNAHHLSQIQIPRNILCESPEIIELHSFSDASQKAYGACIYMKSIDKSGNVTINLLCSKSKVAPIKATTIPRLELSAALLAARLCKAVTDSIRYQVTRKIHWCDSSVVLSWLRTSFTNLKQFVANRVSEICELSDPSCWRYVPTAENPADYISRGVAPNEIQHISMWWSGPKFLYQSEPFWPILNNKILENDLPELKCNIVSTKIESVVPFKNYSNLNKLKRVYAYVNRFIYNLKNRKAKRVGHLTLDELTSSFNFLCSISQQESFAQEFNQLKRDKQLNSKSSILPLSPFFDHNNNTIRVGGRLDASDISFNQRHPILLHSSHYFTKLIFECEHTRNLHAGPQLLLACVRQTIWPINGRLLARSTVHKCTICRRVQGKTLTPLMGNLPAQRVTADYPFRAVGVDFAGPFLILNRKGRGSRVIKCYLCLFVCLRYKCLHLEAVSDLTKDAFLSTLRRFISRRGKPREIFCDNGRNFVAASREIGSFIKANSQSISEYATREEIKFIFSPPYAPHFGGNFERGIQSVKFHVKRVMGNTHLTYEELSTLFAQVEALLNSRPLCPMSSSPNDLLFLTPGHFLIGRSLTALPTPILEDLKSNQLERYTRLEQIRQHFWRRWQREYLSELQVRTKWRTNCAKLSIGDMVIIHEENLPPLCWRLGRVCRLFPGPDGVSRVADIQTNRGTCVSAFKTKNIKLSL